MKLERRAGVMLSVALLVVGNIATAVALSGVSNTVDQNLTCTHDFVRMSCDFKAPNCSGYNLTLQSDSRSEEVHCIVKQCDSERCCCCPEQMFLIYGETHNARVCKGAECFGSKIISIADSFKPRVPTNVTVKESNGNFEVTWRTNMEHRPSVSEDLTAIVTYRKKGDTEKVSKSFQPATDWLQLGLKYYEIPGQYLEPNTTYLVSVRSNSWYGLPSDSSEEVEFTTR
ncbi:uncharacterized protein [Pagrus major]|uniref:uncharacterized protein n=1 Tax=Pagrus major TaxID=143350 RepID=UPI003CC85E9C